VFCLTQLAIGLERTLSARELGGSAKNTGEIKDLEDRTRKKRCVITMDGRITQSGEQVQVNRAVVGEDQKRTKGQKVEGKKNEIQPGGTDFRGQEGSVGKEKVCKKA